jgi:hypothetical protein
MNATVEYTHQTSSTLTKDDFGERLKHICQVFRFYSSIILVIVGRKRKKKQTDNENIESVFASDITIVERIPFVI